MNKILEFHIARLKAEKIGLSSLSQIFTQSINDEIAKLHTYYAYILSENQKKALEENVQKELEKFNKSQTEKTKNNNEMKIGAFKFITWVTAAFQVFEHSQRPKLKNLPKPPKKSGSINIKEGFIKGKTVALSEEHKKYLQVENTYLKKESEELKQNLKTILENIIFNMIGPEKLSSDEITAAITANFEDIQTQLNSLLIQEGLYKTKKFPLYTHIGEDDLATEVASKLTEDPKIKSKLKPLLSTYIQLGKIKLSKKAKIKSNNEKIGDFKKADDSIEEEKQKAPARKNILKDVNFQGKYALYAPLILYRLYRSKTPTFERDIDKENKKITMSYEKAYKVLRKKSRKVSPGDQLELRIALNDSYISTMNDKLKILSAICSKLESLIKNFEATHDFNENSDNIVELQNLLSSIGIETAPFSERKEYKPQKGFVNEDNNSLYFEFIFELKHLLVEEVKAEKSFILSRKNEVDLILLNRNNKIPNSQWVRHYPQSAKLAALSEKIEETHKKHSELSVFKKPLIFKNFRRKDWSHNKYSLSTKPNKISPKKALLDDPMFLLMVNAYEKLARELEQDLYRDLKKVDESKSIPNIKNIKENLSRLENKINKYITDKYQSLRYNKTFYRKGIERRLKKLYTTTDKNLIKLNRRVYEACAELTELYAKKINLSRTQASHAILEKLKNTISTLRESHGESTGITITLREQIKNIVIDGLLNPDAHLNNECLYVNQKDFIYEFSNEILSKKDSDLITKLITPAILLLKLPDKTKFDPEFSRLTYEKLEALEKADSILADKVKNKFSLQLASLISADNDASIPYPLIERLIQSKKIGFSRGLNRKLQLLFKDENKDAAQLLPYVKMVNTLEGELGPIQLRIKIEKFAVIRLISRSSSLYNRAKIQSHVKSSEEKIAGIISDKLSSFVGKETNLHVLFSSYAIDKEKRISYFNKRLNAIIIDPTITIEQSDFEFIYNNQDIKAELQSKFQKIIADKDVKITNRPKLFSLYILLLNQKSFSEYIPRLRKELSSCSPMEKINKLKIIVEFLNMDKLDASIKNKLIQLYNEYLANVLWPEGKCRQPSKDNFLLLKENFIKKPSELYEVQSAILNFNKAISDFPLDCKEIFSESGDFMRPINNMVKLFLKLRQSSLINADMKTILENSLKKCITEFLETTKYSLINCLIGDEVLSEISPSIKRAKHNLKLLSIAGATEETQVGHTITRVSVLGFETKFDFDTSVITSDYKINDILILLEPKELLRKSAKNTFANKSSFESELFKFIRNADDLDFSMKTINDIIKRFDRYSKIKIDEGKCQATTVERMAAKSLSTQSANKDSSIYLILNKLAERADIAYKTKNSTLKNISYLIKNTLSDENIRLYKHAHEELIELDIKTQSPSELKKLADAIYFNAGEKSIPLRELISFFENKVNYLPNRISFTAFYKAFLQPSGKRSTLPATIKSFLKMSPSRQLKFIRHLRNTSKDFSGLQKKFIDNLIVCLSGKKAQQEAAMANLDGFFEFYYYRDRLTRKGVRKLKAESKESANIVKFFSAGSFYYEPNNIANYISTAADKFSSLTISEVLSLVEYQVFFVKSLPQKSEKIINALKKSIEEAVRFVVSSHTEELPCTVNLDKIKLFFSKDLFAEKKGIPKEIAAIIPDNSEVTTFLKDLARFKNLCAKISLHVANKNAKQEFISQFKRFSTYKDISTFERGMNETQRISKKTDKPIDESVSHASILYNALVSSFDKAIETEALGSFSSSVDFFSPQQWGKLRPKLEKSSKATLEAIITSGDYKYSNYNENLDHAKKVITLSQHKTIKVINAVEMQDLSRSIISRLDYILNRSTALGKNPKEFTQYFQEIMYLMRLYIHLNHNKTSRMGTFFSMFNDFLCSHLSRIKSKITSQGDHLINIVIFSILSEENSVFNKDNSMDRKNNIKSYFSLIGLKEAVLEDVFKEKDLGKRKFPSGTISSHNNKVFTSLKSIKDAHLSVSTLDDFKIAYKIAYEKTIKNTKFKIHSSTESAYFTQTQSLIRKLSSILPIKSDTFDLLIKFLNFYHHRYSKAFSYNIEHTGLGHIIKSSSRVSKKVELNTFQEALKDKKFIELIDHGNAPLSADEKRTLKDLFSDQHKKPVISQLTSFIYDLNWLSNELYTELRDKFNALKTMESAEKKLLNPKIEYLCTYFISNILNIASHYFQSKDFKDTPVAITAMKHIIDYFQTLLRDTNNALPEEFKSMLLTKLESKSKIILDLPKSPKLKSSYDPRHYGSIHSRSEPGSIVESEVEDGEVERPIGKPRPHSA